MTQTLIEELKLMIEDAGEADASELKEAIRIKMQTSIDEAMKADNEKI